MIGRFWALFLWKTLKYCFFIALLWLVVSIAAPGLVPAAASILGRTVHVDVSSYLQLYRSLVPNLVSAAIIFSIGLSWAGLRKWIFNSRARFFWGKGLFEDAFVVSHGTLSDERRQEPGNHVAFFKTYRDGRTIRVAGPAGNILGDCEVRSISYLLNAISKHRQQPVAIESDTTAYARLSRTIVSLGSPSSNELTEIILSDARNKYASFGQDETGPFIYLQEQRLKIRAFDGSPGRDLGLVLKISNQRFPGHYFYVCAGIGEWGTSGAAWYLANRWRELDDVGEEFGEIVQVEIGSDESARRVRFQAERVKSESREFPFEKFPFGQPELDHVPGASGTLVQEDSRPIQAEVGDRSDPQGVSGSPPPDAG